MAAACLLCLVALTAAGVFTAPGQAVATWVGERIGFGEPGGPPTLRQLRAGWGRGTVAEGQPAHVLVVGPAPGDQRYEFITFKPQAPPGKHWHLADHCFELDLPQARGSVTQGCGILPKGGDLALLGVGGNSDPDQALSYVTGRTSAAVSSIETRFDGKPVATELVAVPEELIRRLGLGQPFKFFIAFLDDARRGGTVEVIARDRAGDALAHGTVPAMNMESIFP